MREEQVQNAVKFLSHPKVRGSPVIYRRSFLEKKGLTKEEIDEAFRRVPVCMLLVLPFSKTITLKHQIKHMLILSVVRGFNSLFPLVIV